MPQERKKSRMSQIGEAVFCIAYLIFDLAAAVIFFVNANGSQTLYLFGVLTLVLCLFPQNNWFRPEGNLAWGIYRNLPLAVTGLCLVILFFLSGNTGGYGLWLMSTAIIVSFACYFPVVLLAKKKPMVGMLMMPKTMAYIWMISMGLGLIEKTF